MRGGSRTRRQSPCEYKVCASEGWLPPFLNWVCAHSQSVGQGAVADYVEVAQPGGWLANEGTGGWWVECTSFGLGVRDGLSPICKGAWLVY